MRKIFIFLLLLVRAVLTITAQDFRYLTSNELKLSDLVGDTITITEIKSLNEVYWEVPDTIWKEKVRRPKLGKHYSLVNVYKGNNQNMYTTPKGEIINKQFQVLKCDEDSSSGFIVSEMEIKLRLLRIDTQERIKINTYNEISFVINSLSKKYKKDFMGKVFYQLKDLSLDKNEPKNYKKEVCVDCEFVYHKYSSYTAFTSLYIILSSGCKFHVNNREDAYVLSESEYYNLQQENLHRLMSEGEYKMYINNVKKNGKILKKGIVKDSVINSITIKDSDLKFSITPKNDCFSIIIENQSNQSVKLDWNEVVFVDEKNISQFVLHKGVRYIDANKQKTASVIAPNSILDDIIVPTSRLYYSSYNNEWSVLSILNYVNKNGEYPVGTQVKLLMPFVINNIRYEYIFTYDVIWQYKNQDIRDKYLK